MASLFPSLCLSLSPVNKLESWTAFKNDHSFGKKQETPMHFILIEFMWFYLPDSSQWYGKIKKKLKKINKDEKAYFPGVKRVITYN